MKKPDVAKAISALKAIPPDLPRPEWLKAGMAAHAAGIDFKTFDQWSSKAPNYDAADAKSTWQSFKSVEPGKGIGPGTLFKMAKDHGWPGKQPVPSKALLASPAKKLVKFPVKNPDNVWNRSKPATADHDYIRSKCGIANGLRMVPDGDALRVFDESMAGALVVPVQRPDGTLSSLQLIPPNDTIVRLKAKGKPGKLNLPGATLEGWFTVGATAPGGFIYVCEGIGQAWACWQATKHPAVVTFGWGRVRGVAKALRVHYPNAHLVLVPDVGKEEDAADIAQEVRAAVACMPEGEVQNFDANDLAKRDGNEALAVLLKAAHVPHSDHPLAQFVPIDAKPKAPRWIIPGFIGHGVVIIAGAHGVGKTTALLPLSMVAAGLHGLNDPLAPTHWRHVVYIIEDIEQARRILAGIVGFGGLGLTMESVRDRLHLVEARRLDPFKVVEAGAEYRKRFTRTVGDIEVLPLVVLDTKAAVLELENENDNSEASKAMAILKQGFEGLPTWLIGHIAEQNMTRNNAAGLSLRGGSAFEADANQVLYMVDEDGTRYLVRGKTRFEGRWDALQIKSSTAETIAQDEYGEKEKVTMRWGIASPAQTNRKEVAEQAKEKEHKQKDADLRGDVRYEIAEAWDRGNPLNREGVKAKIKRSRKDVADCIENLISEQWLHEVPVPTKERINPKKSSFLVILTTVEHEAFKQSGKLPPAKLVVPPSWKKQPTPVVLEPEPQAVQEASDAKDK